MANTCRGTVGDQTFQINRIQWVQSFNFADHLVSPACSGILGFKKIPTPVHDAWAHNWGLLPAITVTTEKRGQQTVVLFENVGLINKIYDGGLWKFRFLATRVLVF